jgi:hypothetical protein
MANEEQLSIIKKGHIPWNEWRAKNPGLKVDLSGADLRGIDLSVMPALNEISQKGDLPPDSSWSFIRAEIIGYDVMPLNLSYANLSRANFHGSDLRFANFLGADLSGAKLNHAKLSWADLSSCRFERTDLRDTDLSGSDLSRSVFINTNMQGVNISRSNVYGVSVWDVVGEPKDETNLVVTPKKSSPLIIDNLSMAQFLYFLLKNSNARQAIDTLTTKVVFILGNFNKDRKPILDAIKERLRLIGYIPMLFDFTGPESKDVTGTVETLARISRFVIADISDPRSIPHELAITVPFLRSTPFLLIREKGSQGYSMVSDLLAYPWVIEPYEYLSMKSLKNFLPEIIAPAIELAEKYRSGAR